VCVRVFVCVGLGLCVGDFCVWGFVCACRALCVCVGGGFACRWGILLTKRFISFAFFKTYGSNHVDFHHRPAWGTIFKESKRYDTHTNTAPHTHKAPHTQPPPHKHTHKVTKPHTHSPWKELVFQHDWRTGMPQNPVAKVEIQNNPVSTLWCSRFGADETQPRASFFRQSC